MVYGRLRKSVMPLVLVKQMGLKSLFLSPTESLFSCQVVRLVDIFVIVVVQFGFCVEIGFSSVYHVLFISLHLLTDKIESCQINVYGPSVNVLHRSCQDAIPSGMTPLLWYPPPPGPLIG